MSAHGDHADHLAEESKRFFTFFNVSLLLVLITGFEIVIIYIAPFSAALIFTALMVMSVVKFIAVIWWFMHLRWDKALCTILFLMGLIIAICTFIAVGFLMTAHDWGATVVS